MTKNVNEGHQDESPLCSLCEDGFYAYSFSCVRCPHGSVQRSVTVVCLIVLTFFFLGVFTFVGWISFGWVTRTYLWRCVQRCLRIFENASIQQQQEERTQGNSARAQEARRKGLDKLVDGGKVKILLSFAQVSAVYNVVYDVSWENVKKCRLNLITDIPQI